MCDLLSGQLLRQSEVMIDAVAMATDLPSSPWSSPDPQPGPPEGAGLLPVTEGCIMGTRKWRPIIRTETPSRCCCHGNLQVTTSFDVSSSVLPVFLRLSQLFQEAAADGRAAVLLILIAMAAAAWSG